MSAILSRDASTYPAIFWQLIIRFLKKHYPEVQLCGYTVYTQSRPGDIISELKVLSPSLIIIDQHLGHADGCHLCAMIKSKEVIKHIPIIKFSAYHNMEARCLASGADAFLTKPFDMHVLVGTMHSLQQHKWSIGAYKRQYISLSLAAGANSSGLLAGEEKRTLLIMFSDVEKALFSTHGF